MNCCEPLFEAEVIQPFQRWDRDRVISQQLSYWDSSRFISLACFLPSQVYLRGSCITIVNLAAIV